MKKVYATLYLFAILVLFSTLLLLGEAQFSLPFSPNETNSSNLTFQSSSQLKYKPDCDFILICMNWSQCLRNNSRYRYCYDVNNCTAHFKTLEYEKCNYTYENHCMDGKRDFDETDVDCGGSCKPCPIGKRCIRDEDCESRGCDMLSFMCVPRDEKTSRIGAFAIKHPFNFGLLVITTYLLLFWGTLFLIERSFKFREHAFEIEMERRRMQNSIDLFYLFLSRKDFQRAELAYKLAIAIGEKITDFLSPQDLEDLEELREDYEKLVVRQEEKEKKGKKKRK